MSIKFLLALLGLAVVAAAPSYAAPSSEAKYNLQWPVSDESSENHYGQQEARDGDDTQGSYSVVLPDGRTQTVTYYVDGNNGYVANVAYSGEAQYSSAESGSSESLEAREPPAGPHVKAREGVPHVNLNI